MTASPLFRPPPELQESRLRFLRRLNDADPRLALQARLEVAETILEHLNERLKAESERSHEHSRAYNHWLFLQAEHEARRQRLVDELRQVNLDGEGRYGQLTLWVEKYLENHGFEEEVETELEPEVQAVKQRLEGEIQTWQGIIHKLRLRMQKHPGDATLTRLLGEHQGRLLRVQEVLQQISAAGSEEQALVVEQVSKQMEVHEESDPALLQMQRELMILEGMLVKTEERLFKKPDLLHLRDLIQAHRARRDDLLAQIQARREDLLKHNP